MTATDDIPAFMRGPNDDRLNPAKPRVIDDEPGYGTGDRLVFSDGPVSLVPEIVVHAYNPGVLVGAALAIALGVGLGLLGSSLATDWLVGHGYWPGMTFEVEAE